MTGPGPADQAPPDPAPDGGPPPAAPSGLPAWTSQLTSTAPVPGPAGLYYADVPNRIIAQIIDAILVAIVSIIVSVVLFAIVGSPSRLVADPNAFLGFRTETNIVPTLIFAVFGIAISAGYYVYTWTAMRGTIGQKALGMQVGNAADGATLTMEQAVRRWLALGGVFSLAQTLNPLPGVGLLLVLAGLVWVIALLVTTAQSPTKQGLHDQFAKTVVVKAARAVG